MQDQLKRFNIPFERFEAIDGAAQWDTIKSSVDTEQFEKNVGRKVLPGEIGFYHSHLSVWQKIANDDCECALVLEDDVVLHSNFLEAISAAWDCRHQWDFLKLNKIRAKQPVKQFLIAEWAVNAYIGPATGFGVYLITKSFAQRIVPQMLPIKRPIDLEFDRIFAYDFRHFGLEPFPSHVDDGDQSTITGASFSKVAKFPWYARLHAYKDRLARLVCKLVYLARTGRLFRRVVRIENQSTEPPFFRQ